MLWLGLFAGCGSDPVGEPPLAPEGPPAACSEGMTYPEGAVEPMALGEVLSPYSWPVAIDRRTGAEVALDLAAAPCDLAAELGWSQFEALLFVSIPAW